MARLDGKHNRQQLLDELFADADAGSSDINKLLDQTVVDRGEQRRLLELGLDNSLQQFAQGALLVA